MWSTDPVDPLKAAQASIRAYCGWHVAPIVEETITRDGSGRSTLLLPTMHVVDVLSVHVAGEDVTDRVRWSEAGMLEGVVFPRRFRNVQVTLLHGYDPDAVPDLAALIIAVGSRASAGSGGVVQQAAGGMSMRLGTASDGSVGGVPLFASEKAFLNQYRVTWGV